MRDLVRTIAAAAFALLLIAGVSAAQEWQDPPTTGTFFGRVTDMNGVSLTAVKVVARPVLEGASLVTTTRDDGTYELKDVPPGVYVLEFSLPGQPPAFRNNGLVALAGSRQQVDVRLPAAGAAGAPATAAGGFGAAEVLVRLETPVGNIDLSIDTTRAPTTAANFLKYVDGGFYDGGRFHRATRPDNYTPAPPNRPAMELIQGGINPERRSQAFPPIPLERTSVTGLKHVIGVVSMARGTAADTATSDFFILLDNQPSLDFGGKRFDDEQGAAAFGRVVAGLDVVRKIQQQPVQGQSLTPPVPIVKASRIR
jgi:peptidyl-prolyl cis-trans isomerase A (cyclophilin A)